MQRGKKTWQQITAEYGDDYVEVIQGKEISHKYIDLKDFSSFQIRVDLAYSPIHNQMQINSIELSPMKEDGSETGYWISIK